MEVPPHGGCTFAEQPQKRAETATILWRGECDTTVLPVWARRARRTDPNAFDLTRIVYPVYIFRDPDGTEHLLIGDAGHHLRLDILRGSVLDGPVRLQYRLTDGYALPTKLLTLRRLLALERLGRFPHPLFPCEPRATHWIQALQAIDGHAVGASHREIAVALYGEAIVDTDWGGSSDYLRCRVQRALRFGDTLVHGGYRRLLRRY